MSVAIKVENLSKKYIIRHQKKSGSYQTFSDTIIQGSRNIANKIIIHQECIPKRNQDAGYFVSSSQHSFSRDPLKVIDSR